MAVADHTFEGVEDRCTSCKRTRADVLSGGGIACRGSLTGAERESIQREIERIWQATADAAQS